MRLLYLTLTLFCSVTIYSQEVDNFQSQTEQLELKLYPNPAYGETVQIVTDSNLPKEVTVYDVFGKIVLTDRIYRNNLSITSLHSGIYMLQITENQKTVNRKLVIK
ncbi:T9SS type A sorting domain-containing protein [Pseudozobellia sp. WGM2]|uniref:T9SS type A sorting domain-containing protein n=1 Tax=Pseudozobellia sp. WGM2 TaxID=2787625 RepID=UPI001ADF8C1D|nr:T9SS type A sorting domain-containing protein [Pseudozobellia sp. WGM2]